jgi:hypothetical protein
MDQKVAREVAELDFARFLDMMDLDADMTRMDPEDTKSFEEAKHRLVRAIERGHLAIDEKGQPVYTPQGGTQQPITFFEPTGASFIAMDSKKKDQNVAKLCAVMADMTRQNAALFAKLPARDFKVCQTIVTLFLG